MPFKCQYINKETGRTGIGNVLTKEIDVKGGTAYRTPLNFKEAQKICDYANENYINAVHMVVSGR